LRQGDREMVLDKETRRRGDKGRAEVKVKVERKSGGVEI